MNGESDHTGAQFLMDASSQSTLRAQSSTNVPSSLRHLFEENGSAHSEHHRSSINFSDRLLHLQTHVEDGQPRDDINAPSSGIADPTTAYELLGGYEEREERTASPFLDDGSSNGHVLTVSKSSQDGPNDNVLNAHDHDETFQEADSTNTFDTVEETHGENLYRKRLEMKRDDPDLASPSSFHFPYPPRLDIPSRFPRTQKISYSPPVTHRSSSSDTEPVHPSDDLPSPLPRSMLCTTPPPTSAILDLENKNIPVNDLRKLNEIALTLHSTSRGAPGLKDVLKVFILLNISLQTY